MSDFTKGEWEYVSSNECHGPYVAAPGYGDICDCYVMSRPSEASTLNGGESEPIHHQGDQADGNARLIAAAGTAATRAEEMGYDGARALECAAESVDLLKRLVDGIKTAIQAGDWMVDGACDPDMDIGRAERLVAQARKED